MSHVAAATTSHGDELAAFVATLDRFLLTNVDALGLSIDRAHAIPGPILMALAELGVFGVTIPEAYGGSDLGLAGACAIVDTLARRDRAIATTVGLHLGLGTRGLVAFGTEAQKRRWLPGLASGAQLAAFATTEPNAGSDLTRLATHARRRDDRVVVDGQKLFVTNGALAGVYTITVATQGHGEPPGTRALMVLERGDRGISIGPEEDKLGLRGSSTTPLYFDGVDVAADRLIGPLGQGAEQLAHILSWGRTTMAAGCCGTAQAALDKTLTHVRDRHQFGRALGAQPVVRAQLADMVATLHAMRALVYATATTTDAHARERLSLSSKIYCSEGDWGVCDTALQLHGGLGFIEESGLPLLLRDARITRIFEGANDVLASRLGQLELTAPPRPEATPYDAVAAIDARVAALTESARARGLAALRDPVLLHRLGRVAALRDAAHAVAAAHRPGSHASAEPVAMHALSRLREAVAAADAIQDLVTTAPICDALLELREKDSPSDAGARPLQSESLR